jgi:ribosome-associated translation inhibitor RaiA
MHIQINTDHKIEGHEALAAHLSGLVKNALSHLAEHITRVELHLSDENGSGKDRGSNDKRCLLEARLESYPPVAVTAHADTVHQSVTGAADKLARLIEKTLGRLHDHKHRREAPSPSEETSPEA